MAPMEIELRSLSEGPNSLSWEVGSVDLDIQEEVGLCGKARVGVTVTKSGESLVAHCRVGFNLKLTCCRCLRPIEHEADASFDLVIQKDKPEVGSGELDDTDVVFYEENAVSVDVASQVRDAIILDIPMKPLCSEACQGLCPICGADLNQETCSCQKDDIDPRWEALRQIKGG